MYEAPAFPSLQVECEFSRGDDKTEGKIRPPAASTMLIDELLRRKIVPSVSLPENAEQQLCSGGIESGKLSLVACNTRDTVIIKDAEHRIEWVNDSFTRNYGYSLDECRGQYEQTLIGDSELLEDDAAEIHFADKRSKSSGRSRTEVIRYGKDGKKRWLTLECRPLVNGEGVVTGFIEIESDITEHKLAEAALLQEKRAAEAALQAKSDFLATVCHEIRNPVNVMIGMLDMTLKTILTAEQRDYLSLMKTSSGSLLRVINDLLDLARIDAGCLDVENVPFSLRESTGDALKMFAFEAQRKGLALAWDIAPNVPDALLGDPMRLRQIVINLLGNAIKFTEHGDVVMRIECESIYRGEVVCRFSLRDSGAGIPKDKQASIFKPFRQADTSTARQFGGSGLGLAISARLVEMMNGTIWVESEPGLGSTFYFTARFFLQPRVSRESRLPNFRGLQALVVVGHPVNRRFLINTLRRWNVDVDEADSGTAALTCIDLAKGAQKPYRLVLLDNALTDMDSDALALRMCGRYGLAVSEVLILGSFLRRQEEGSGGDTGAFPRLTMPVKPSELLAAIAARARAVSARSVRSGTAIGIETGTAAEPCRAEIHALNLTILLVDDSPISRRLSQLLLEQMGCRVLLAEHGEQALEIHQRESLDLVLMDMHMPRMDGVQTTQAIRRRETAGGTRLPVIALTAQISERDSEYCLQAGLDACLTKPIEPARLHEIVERLNGSRNRNEVAIAPPCRSMVLDKSALLVQVNGDKELLREIGDLFLRSCGSLMSRARKALLDRDRNTLANLLHTLLGMFRSLSANAAQELTEKLQQLCVENDPERLAATYAQLEDEVRALTAALAALRREMQADSPVGGFEPGRSTAKENARKSGSLVAMPVITIKPWHALQSKARLAAEQWRDRKPAAVGGLRLIHAHADLARLRVVRASHGTNKSLSRKQ